jgi:C4-dicarboxylate-specific signal transduction histidine kinase
MSSQPSTATKPLEEALDLTEAVQEVVRQSADELLVINAVLKQELPDHVQVGEVAEALQKTDQIESRINESAADLAHVNQLLEQEIDERADVERELAVTKAALAEAQNTSSAN